MKKIIALVLVLLVSVATGYSHPVKESKTYLVTNSWDTCVDLFNTGPQQSYAFMLNYISGYNISIGSCMTNYINGHGPGFYDPPCMKEHISDYPKTSTKETGIQTVHEYQLPVIIGDTTNTTHWKQYDYPHKKIVTTHTVEIKFVTTDTTNETVTANSVKCKTCGK